VPFRTDHGPHGRYPGVDEPQDSGNAVVNQGSENRDRKLLKSFPTISIELPVLIEIARMNSMVPIRYQRTFSR
jgi:hypothetical protein